MLEKTRKPTTLTPSAAAILRRDRLNVRGRRPIIRFLSHCVRTLPAFCADARHAVDASAPVQSALDSGGIVRGRTFVGQCQKRIPMRSGSKRNISRAAPP